MVLEALVVDIVDEPSATGGAQEVASAVVDEALVVAAGLAAVAVDLAVEVDSVAVVDSAVAIVGVSVAVTVVDSAVVMLALEGVLALRVMAVRVAAMEVGTNGEAVKLAIPAASGAAVRLVILVASGVEVRRGIGEAVMLRQVTQQLINKWMSDRIDTP